MKILERAIFDELEYDRTTKNNFSKESFFFSSPVLNGYVSFIKKSKKN